MSHIASFFFFIIFIAELSSGESEKSSALRFSIDGNLECVGKIGGAIEDLKKNKGFLPNSSFVNDQQSADYKIKVTTCKKEVKTAAGKWDLAEVRAELISNSSNEKEIYSEEAANLGEAINEISDKLVKELHNKLVQKNNKQTNAPQFAAIALKNPHMLSNEALVEKCENYKDESKPCKIGWRLPYAEELSSSEQPLDLHQRYAVADKKFYDKKYSLVNRGNTSEVIPERVLQGQDFSRTLYCICAPIKLKDKCIDEIYALYRGIFKENTKDRQKLSPIELEIEKLLLYFDKSKELQQRILLKDKPSENNIKEIIEKTNIEEKKLSALVGSCVQVLKSEEQKTITPSKNNPVK